MQINLKVVQFIFSIDVQFMTSICLSPTLFLCVWSFYLCILFPTLLSALSDVMRKQGLTQHNAVKSDIFPHLQVCSKLILMPKRERRLNCLVLCSLPSKASQWKTSSFPDLQPALRIQQAAHHRQTFFLMLISLIITALIKWLHNLHAHFNLKIFKRQ